MSDKLNLKIIDPRGKEKWAADCRIDEVVEIYLNGVELIEILRVIEVPYASKEGHPNLTGAYGHITPEELCKNLTEYETEVELLCCSGCGDSGCWSILIDIEKDADYVYWKAFKHNHREWKYDISYQFDREAYEKELRRLGG